MIGILWFDDDKKTPLNEKIIAAADCYRGRFGRVPTICLVSAKQVEKEFSLGVLSVRPERYILPHHFLVGVEGAATAKGAKGSV